jgi:DNA-binding transcriptional MerR regulator
MCFIHLKHISLIIHLDLNVGITIKNIGAYLKVPNRTSPDTIKTFNSSQLNNQKDNSTFSQTTTTTTTSNNKVSNIQAPTTSNLKQSTNGSNTQRLQTADSGNSLPRIRINS